MALVLSRPRCPATAPPAQLGFAELHDEVGVSASGPAGVDAGVEVCGRLQIFVPNSCRTNSYAPGLASRIDFGRQMAELVRGDFHPQMPQNGLLDRDLNRGLGSRLAR